LDGAVVGDPTGESNGEALRLDFDRRLMLEFRGSVQPDKFNTKIDR
jgi:hypothetical protein